jgi:hypothetical protein
MKSKCCDNSEMEGICVCRLGAPKRITVKIGDNIVFDSLGSSVGNGIEVKATLISNQ